VAKRKTEKDYHNLAKSRGFKWVGVLLPKNTQTKTLWFCKKKHKWQARYADIYSGNGCPYCAGSVSKTEKDYHGLAKFYCFKWVDKKLPKNIHTRTKWLCKNKHVFISRYGDIRMGTGCPYCCGRAPKIEKDYYILATKRCFRWVGKTLPKNVATKTWWECKNGHCWEATYRDIKAGNECPYCYIRRVRKKIIDYHNLAKLRNFKWLGNILPENTNIKTLWGCKKGHQWLSRYADIHSGYGCPYCVNMINGAKVSKVQIELNNLLCGSLNYSEGKYRIDVAIMRNSQKIAVEYDCQYWHEGREERGSKRDCFLVSHGWKVLHVKSGNLLPTRKQIKQSINKVLNSNRMVCNLYLEDWKK
jgi:hypothetical protein